MEQINIRGRNYNSIQKKRASDSLYECVDCEGCIYEDICRKYEEMDFKKKVKTLKEGE